MNGIQHYVRPINKNSRTLKQEQENDAFKQKIALDNGINNYIVIDARFSDYEYIKYNILKSELSKLFDLSNVDWNDIFLKSSKSFIFQIANLWNSNTSIIDICNKMHFNRNFVRDCLNKATLINLCDYTPEKSIQRKIENDSKKVLCVEDKIIYGSIEEVGRTLNVSSMAVRRCCDLSFENLN